MAKPANLPQTLTDVANLALARIGIPKNQRLTDLDTDTGTVADEVNTIIYQMLAEVISEFYWPDLTVDTIIETADATYDNSEREYSYRFALPDDFIRADDNRDTGGVVVGDDNPLTLMLGLSTEYLIENGYIYCHESENRRLRYIKYSEDPTEWGTLLTKCMYLKLGMHLSVVLNQGDETYNAMRMEFEALDLKKAKRIESMQRKYPNTSFRRGKYQMLRSGRNAFSRGLKCR